LQRVQQADEAETARDIRITGRDIGTGIVIAAAIIIGFTRLRGRKSVRIPFQLLLVVYVGLINGDLLSQAMLVGWSQNGVPMTSAISLVALTLAAFLVPMTSRVNVYCSHICPHGAAQQLVMRKLPWQVHVPSRIHRILSAIPAVLLLWVLLVTMLWLTFSLVDIEPFDAYVWNVAGWATITIAVVGLAASLFVPMAYCRYGCPTGAVLGFLRFNARSDRLSLRDLIAVGLLTVALAIRSAT
jgi:polyferredoxin